MPAISHKHRVVYFPIPKNATSSMKRIIYELDTNRNWDGGDQKELGVNIHNIYPAERRFQWYGHFDKYCSIVILRDPVSRVLATYGNRVVHSKALVSDKATESNIEKAGLNANPDLHEFVNRFEEYQSASRVVRNHTISQATLLKDFWDRITHKLPIQEVGKVPDIIESHTGIRLELSHSQTGGPKFKREDLDADQLKKLERLYAEDLVLLSGVY